MPATEAIEVEAPGDISSAIPAHEITPQGERVRGGGNKSRPVRAYPEHVSGSALARDIGATGHVVFAIARGARGRKLAPLLASDFPDLPPLAAGRLIDAAMDAVTPFCWAGGGAGTNASDDLRWARRLKGALPGPAGLAFPVAAGRGETGLVAFVGERFSVSDRTLPDLHRRCFGLFTAAFGRPGDGARQTAPLAKRELECIRLAADGLTSGDIAKALGLSLHTANQYLAEAARKLNAAGRMHAVAKALRLGLID
ncbi:MAG: hypothetical protein BGN87_21920 [Rhizobiales bacterium 65-79]|jgi:DNA-binding CsgD family transcriptional regulator|nr:MAG: hypothetical protein BGN87_21920 [Rhizobiales bacterium 65-79]